MVKLSEYQFHLDSFLRPIRYFLRYKSQLWQESQWLSLLRDYLRTELKAVLHNSCPENHRTVRFSTYFESQAFCPSFSKSGATDLDLYIVHSPMKSRILPALPNFINAVQPVDLNKQINLQEWLLVGLLRKAIVGKSTGTDSCATAVGECKHGRCYCK